MFWSSNRMRNVAVCLVAAAAALVWFNTGTACAALIDVLKVDFGASGQPVQPGFQAFSSGSGTANTPGVQSYTTPLGSVSVTLDTDHTTGLGFRTRSGNTLTGPFASLESLLRTEGKSRDGAPDNVSQTLSLILGGLTSGWDYTITTYHHGVTHNSSQVSDFVLALDGVYLGTYSHSLGWDPISISTVDIPFTADGVNPVILTFTVPAAEIVLNGFELTAIPEPSGLILLAFGSIALLLWRRK